MDRCINNVEKQLSALDEMDTWAKTIHSNGEKICKKALAMKKCISEERDGLREGLDALKQTLRKSELLPHCKRHARFLKDFLYMTF